jgi:uncharacterized surface protein with fasciclin (FAS1) repeats
MKISTKIRQYLTLLFVGTILSATITSCDKDDPAPVSNTITDIVVADPNLTLLEQGVLRADLAGTLSGTGPFTVFAPTDAAFTAAGITSPVIAAIPAGEMSTILLYHTIPSEIFAANVPAGPNAKVITASGDSVFVTRNTNGVYINGIKVTTADIDADNGVIHKIGSVLFPADGNIVETAVASGLDSLAKAATTAGLVGVLSNATLTVFAPTNQAFTDLLAALGLTDINDIPLTTLQAVLTYHVVGGRAFSSDLTNGSLTMLASNTTTTNLTNGTGGVPTILGAGNGGNKSNIIGTNIVCDNGVVHLIDRVLLP